MPTNPHLKSNQDDFNSKLQAALSAPDLWAPRGGGFCLLALICCTLIGLLFYLLGLDESAIITVYNLGVLVAAARTDKKRWWVLTAIAAILLFNCLFAEPRFTLLYYDSRHTVTMLLLMATALLVGFLSQNYRRQLLARAQADAKAQDERTRADLLRSVGHDLRTPLTGISGDAQLLLSHGEQMPQDRRAQLYQHIYDNAEWLVAMVENILFVTRLESGGLSIGREPELVSELIDEALLHLSRKSSEHLVSREVDDEMLLILGDANLLIQVLVNLLNNAIRHTQTGSHITVSAHREEDTVRIEVADDGPGLSAPPEQVFSTFYSTPSLSPAEPHGMGLGLPLAQAIIQAHGSELYYRENEPSGAVFGFVLPLETVSEQL